jgi:hypothetical protein
MLIEKHLSGDTGGRGLECENQDKPGCLVLSIRRLLNEQNCRLLLILWREEKPPSAWLLDWLSNNLLEYSSRVLEYVV